MVTGLRRWSLPNVNNLTWLRLKHWTKPSEAKADSGLVTCGSQKSLLQVISYCGKVLRTKKTHAALTVMSILVSAAIMTILLFANMLGGLTPLTITLYQLAWLVPVLITSRVFIR